MGDGARIAHEIRTGRGADNADRVDGAAHRPGHLAQQDFRGYRPHYRLGAVQGRPGDHELRHVHDKGLETGPCKLTGAQLLPSGRLHV
jgi:hypothetical protein